MVDDDSISKLIQRIEALERRISQLEISVRKPRDREELISSMSKWKPWPKDQPLQYNGSGSPCDAWIGPCQCGAYHIDGK